MSAAAAVVQHSAPPKPNFVVRFTHSHLSLESLTEILEGFLHYRAHHRKCEKEDQFELGLLEVRTWATLESIIQTLTGEIPVYRAIYKAEDDEPLMELSVYSKH